jgi:hypothetical protein
LIALKFKFKSRKDMGLEPGALPFKFRIEIDPNVDDDTEVTRKRSLLRLNSSKVYNLMGLSVKAHEAQKSALNWLVRMADEMDIDDPSMQDELKTLLPLITSMQKAAKQLTDIRKAKIQQAEQMEEIATKARTAARKVRHRISKKTAAERKEVKEEFFLMRLPDSSVDMPLYFGQDDPMAAFKEAADAIIKKEKSKYEPEEPDEY